MLTLCSGMRDAAAELQLRSKASAAANFASWGAREPTPMNWDATEAARLLQRSRHFSARCRRSTLALRPAKLTAAVADEFCKHIAVGTCNGEISVINFSSGGVLYNLPHRNLEITSLKFLTGCKYLHFNF